VLQTAKPFATLVVSKFTVTSDPYDSMIAISACMYNQLVSEATEVTKYNVDDELEATTSTCSSH
jgi:hypothetical protein